MGNGLCDVEHSYVPIYHLFRVFFFSCVGSLAWYIMRDGWMDRFFFIHVYACMHDGERTVHS